MTVELYRQFTDNIKCLAQLAGYHSTAHRLYPELHIVTHLIASYYIRRC